MKLACLAALGQIYKENLRQKGAEQKDLRKLSA
jgi:hypothetical protein